MEPISRKTVKHYVCNCVRCGAIWNSRFSDKPKRCAYCGSCNWWREPLWTHKKKKEEGK